MRFVRGSDAALAVGLVALLAVGSARAASDPHHASSVDSVPGHAHHHVDTSNGRPDAVITGPQGGRGQFVVECPFSHRAADDPIVYPGQPGASHEHMFFGNESADAFSTAASLAAAPTNCDQALDFASYWAPALYDGDALVPAVKSTAYYRAGVGVDPMSVQPFPTGLKMIAGNAAAVDPQPVEVVAWTCGTSGERRVEPPECPPSRMLRMIVTFADCWNGVDLDADDHHSHVAYSSSGACPSSHPVPIPQLQFSVEYRHSGETTGLRLASGGLISGHADFFNAWDPTKLATEVNLCIRRDTVCGITSGRKTG